MKPLTIKLIEDAAFEAHMAVADMLRRELGRDPKPVDVAQVLSQAFGDALGLYCATGPTEAQIKAVDAISDRAANAMFSRIAAPTCGGGA